MHGLESNPGSSLQTEEDPRGVRPRLEGTPRTPLSSRVATRVSWSPLSGLKPTPAPSPPHLWHSPCRCSPLYRCSCGTRCWPGSSRGLHRGWRSRGHSLWGEAAVSARLAGRLPRALDAGPGLVPCWCVCGMQVGSPRSLLGEQIWGTLSGGGAGLVRGPTERPGRPTPSQAKVTTPGRQLRTPALPCQIHTKSPPGRATMTLTTFCPLCHTH